MRCRLPSGYRDPLAEMRIAGPEGAFGALEWRSHWSVQMGVDLASRHAPVYAVAPGRVVAVGNRRQYGLTIVIEHSRGVESLYARLAKALAKARPGALVAAGEQIAVSGDARDPVVPPLHFELSNGGPLLRPNVDFGAIVPDNAVNPCGTSHTASATISVVGNVTVTSATLDGRPLLPVDGRNNTFATGALDVGAQYSALAKSVTTHSIEIKTAAICAGTWSAAIAPADAGGVVFRANPIDHPLEVDGLPNGGSLRTPLVVYASAGVNGKYLIPPSVHGGGRCRPPASPSPSPSPTVSPSPSPTVSPSPSPSPTVSASPHPGPTVSPSPRPTPTPSPTGCTGFPAGDPYYRQAISAAPVDPSSSAYIASAIAAGNTASFYASTGVEQVNLATNSTPLLTVHQKVSWNTFPMSYPWTSGFYVEPLSDRHAMVLQTQTCHLYEAYLTTYSGGVLSAYSGANWDLAKNYVPVSSGHPSAMASGLPIFPGMVMWSDYLSGKIAHPLNWTTIAGTASQWKFVLPASNTDGITFNGTSAFQMPYGARLRLKASFSTSGWGPQATMVAQAMKTYGIYLADSGYTGNGIYFANAPNGSNPWNNDDLRALSHITLADFDVVILPKIQVVPGH
jgi:hypothetical protein